MPLRKQKAETQKTDIGLSMIAVGWTRVCFSVFCVFAFLISVSGCDRVMYDSDLATRPYSIDLHTTETVDIQVFRDEESIDLINATARTYRDFDLWINQRYSRHIDELLAGETITVSLWDFYDERGDRFNAGGFWRTREAERLRLTEIQPAPNLPMVGLITIRAEDVK